MIFLLDYLRKITIKFLILTPIKIVLFQIINYVYNIHVFVSFENVVIYSVRKLFLIIG